MVGYQYLQLFVLYLEPIKKTTKTAKKLGTTKWNDRFSLFSLQKRCLLLQEWKYDEHDTKPFTGVYQNTVFLYKIHMWSSSTCPRALSVFYDLGYFNYVISGVYFNYRNDRNPNWKPAVTLMSILNGKTISVFCMSRAVMWSVLFLYWIFSTAYIASYSFIVTVCYYIY